MKKKALGLVMAGALALGGLGIIPAFAAESDKAPSVTEKSVQKGEGNHFHGKRHMNSEWILEKAKELGIETEGKDIHQVAKEVFETKVKAQAKELGIKTEGRDIHDVAKEVFETKVKAEAKKLGIETEGRDIRDVAKEVFETKVKSEAKELGIETEGKDIHQVAKEVRERKVFQAAEKLGIDTKNKTTEELMKEIKENHAAEAKEMGLFSDKWNFFYLKGGFHHLKDGKQQEGRQQ
ncbi:MAG TPA: hypothetical protein VNM45_12150 [Bacillus sp. (in: firmicutes)]|nr:hypothetical protein [Bacillus sp. (in: firmicutes)]